MFKLITLALLAATACKKDSTDDTAEWVDADNDGYDTSSDCDDSDPDINPGADEVCDGLDNDCNGVADDDAVDATAWYTDADADAYGDDATEVLLCSAERSDQVTVGGDCDDADASAFPGGTEVCDSVDNDCDGEIDNEPVDGSTFYPDLDGDGYGDGSSPTEACDGASGVVEDSSDCDDADAATNPGAEEVCDDGIDNDCDGTDNGCSLPGVQSLADADIVWTGSNAGDKMGGPVRSVGDLDGDGFQDIALSARGFGDSQGAIYLVDGPYTAGSFDIETVAYARIAGANSGDTVYPVTGVGDWNGDGFNDLILSAQSSDEGGSDSGAVHLFLGTPSGQVDTDSAQITLAGEAASDRASVLSDAGDVDDDGLPDFLVSAARHDSQSGAVYLVTGDSVSADGSLADSTAVFYGADSGNQFGGGLSGAGDLNGDGISDFLVGVPLDDTAAEDAGGVAVIFGQAGMSGSFSSDDVDVFLSGPAINNQAGYGIGPAGDHDGDGNEDILVSATRSDLGGTVSGAVYLIAGPFTADGTMADNALATIAGEAADDRMAPSYGTADLNGDSQLDVTVAARGNSSGAGAAYLFYGPLSGSYSASAADGIFTGELAGDGAGAPVNVPGDLDGNGLPDLMVGARDADVAGVTDAGAAYVIFSSGL
ncbi:MAG: MopE-related protein [Myxococcota bacterium]|nr:MopE-related protein [Myxococcota bacterium]